MEEYNKIIEGLQIDFQSGVGRKPAANVSIPFFDPKSNTALLVNNGDMFFGDEGERVTDGDILVIPGGKEVRIAFGTPTAKKISKEEYEENKRKYVQNASQQELNDIDDHTWLQTKFDANVLNTPLFATLDLPVFAVKNAPHIANIMRTIATEKDDTTPGKNRVIKLMTEYLVIEIFRYILKNRLFVEQLVTNSTYFKDPRLIRIFTHIKENIGGDLSNKALATVANVSEDYVGQYFKMLTGINPQDYIENERMKAAVDLLRTTKKSIREIGQAVGYKDTAYFCRRYKMMYGIPAGKMRRRESLINV